MKSLILIAALLAACSKPPRTFEGRTCYWQRDDAGIGTTHGVCHRDGYALQCTYEKDREPKVMCASGCVPLESK